MICNLMSVCLLSTVLFYSHVLVFYFLDNILTNYYVEYYFKRLNMIL